MSPANCPLGIAKTKLQVHEKMSTKHPGARASLPEAVRKKSKISTLTIYKALKEDRRHKRTLQVKLRTEGKRVKHPFHSYVALNS